MLHTLPASVVPSSLKIRVLEAQPNGKKDVGTHVQKKTMDIKWGPGSVAQPDMDAR